MEGVVESILRSMSSVNRPQMLFMLSLFGVLSVFIGKATFRNMSRYTSHCEKTYSRWYRRAFDFLEFNTRLIEQEIPQGESLIAAIDASFMKKSGKNTEGLGWFYNGSTAKAERGLEMSLIAVIDLKSNTAYGLDSQQTIDKVLKKGKPKKHSRVDDYAKQVVRASKSMLALNIRYITADSYYAKTKFVNPVLKLGFDIIGKLRNDANLKWLYEGEYSGIGAPRKYDGKVRLTEGFSRFNHDGTLSDGIEVYSAVVWSVSLKRKIKIVVLAWNNGGSLGVAILYSSDLDLSAMDIVKYYKARFQIEFLFRDAKQYTGLMDCQSTKKEAIGTQINASITSLNIMKFEDRRCKGTNDKTVISIASWKRKKMNRHLIGKVLCSLGISQTCKKAMDVYENLSDYGTIAA